MLVGKNPIHWLKTLLAMIKPVPYLNRMTTGPAGSYVILYNYDKLRDAKLIGFLNLSKDIQFKTAAVILKIPTMQII